MKILVINFLGPWGSESFTVISQLSRKESGEDSWAAKLLTSLSASGQGEMLRTFDVSCYHGCLD